MKFTQPVSVFTVAFLISAASFAQSPAGKLNLNKGQKLQVDNNIQSLITQEMMGQKMEITIEANTMHQVEVKDKKAASYAMASTLKKLTTTGSAMGQNINFDSDKKEDLEGEMGKAVKDQINVEKNVELDENAEVVNPEKKDMPEMSGGLMDMVNNVTGAGADESNGAKAAFEILPKGKKVGDTWSDSSITEDMKIYRTYTLKSIAGKKATLALDGKQVTSKKMEQQGMEINVNMEAKLTGESVVDMSTGIVQEKTMVMDGTGTAEMMGQSIPVTTKVTTKTTVKSI